ncbi:glycosyl transferase group 1 [Cellulophaga algicola DSM 14237]|uniref:Glycosyl transferase group 1 n=1 Tax=Cellulophaga algicola (strain DSM 14237 / IC166 / ACAM 630) TaxID=688270 RepID=E6X6F4_CELAD|nr:glycosyltransferase [Cellulophaga algicola]ADV48460.1 glycosyl transferase group 1 [Cellulophaga algicola DSM 14237]
MRINYFFRHPKVGFSIQRVFQTVNLGVKKVFETEETFLPNPKSNIPAIFKNGMFARKKQLDINHITGDAHYLLYFLNTSKTVVTVHDIMYYSYLSGIKKKLWKILYIDSLTRAEKVVFISEFAQQQVLNEINLAQNQYSIIPNPVSPDFTLKPKKFNKVKPVILHIGGKMERKNLARTIQALENISCHLRIIGKLSEKNSQLLQECKTDFSNAFNLTNEEIVMEYENCDIVNFPSLFEGFGMPIIEGQAVGRIVVTSNIPPMNQVAGGGAVLVEPTDITSIKNAYEDIITNAVFREEIIQQGIKNVEKYKLSTITNQYATLYNELIEK